jgi:hypothetical protein
MIQMMSGRSARGNAPLRIAKLKASSRLCASDGLK